ncbi:MAG: serine protease AprX [Actinomycetota bacterium]|nr:serine protease AprX [Actinomycetota bacterium]
MAGASLRHAVIVEASSTEAASSAVAHAGGRVDTSLDLVGGVAAHLNDLGLNELMGESGISVTPDVVLHSTGSSFPSSSTDADPQIASLNPTADWANDAGDNVGVALIDTGVNPTSDLNGDRLVRGPDLSGEGDGVDRFGHGTFMAGLIAGDGTASSREPTRHVGSAPGATVVSVKVAGADGATTLSKLIAGIGWVVVHEDDYNIGVLNLSFGADVNLPYVANPLSGAVEAAWASGITVVTSAGNGGGGTVTSPGDDPWIITVGSSDSAGTGSTSDDTLASWSGTKRFSTYSKPDVVAPGVSVVSLRATGSTIDSANPQARIGDVYFRGSGTSMSTALVSGAAAVLLAHHPDATPDDVKGSLVDGGVTVRGSAAPGVDLQSADDATPTSDWWQRYPIAFGGLGGRLGNQMPWTASRWTATRWTASRWTASRWTASRWTATRWTATRWTASRWTATRWTASRWTDADWTASRWTASRWTDASWNSLGWG